MPDSAHLFALLRLTFSILLRVRPNGPCAAGKLRPERSRTLAELQCTVEFLPVRNRAATVSGMSSGEERHSASVAAGIAASPSRLLTLHHPALCLLPTSKKAQQPSGSSCRTDRAPCFCPAPAHVPGTAPATLVQGKASVVHRPLLDNVHVFHRDVTAEIATVPVQADYRQWIERQWPRVYIPGQCTVKSQVGMFRA